MGHLLYGYKIVSGRAEIDKEQSKQVINVFNHYLDGLSLSAAATKAGINRCHASVGKLLSDKRYLGDEYYAPIITQEVFDKVQEQRQSRVEKLGRIYEFQEPEKCLIKASFYIPEINNEFEDPFRQAEYAYSQIQVQEVKKDGNEYEC